MIEIFGNSTACVSSSPFRGREDIPVKQRRFPRIQLNSKVFVTSANRSFSADTLNLTLHGIFILTHEKINPGTSVEVDITIPCTTRSPHMKLPGVVTRVEHSGLVIEFNRIEGDEFHCLKDILQRRSTHRFKPYIAP
ncbi:MAG: PilZ domain-containing protein [Deltaproteobacteria bacterium]|nr:PilZ domain-containing protein [Deltaproteobacteria bacterium]